MEHVNGLGIWEAEPFLIHQNAVDRIRASIRPADAPGSGCSCVHKPDIIIQFPDGSYKRPDISIFCIEPWELDRPVTLVPEAVVEILSKGYESKDLRIGVPFYLSHGVKDVIVLDPETANVWCFDTAGEREFVSPASISLHCGCTVTV
jgi:Uma2 family endonuclease